MFVVCFAIAIILSIVLGIVESWKKSRDHADKPSTSAAVCDRVGTYVSPAERAVAALRKYERPSGSGLMIVIVETEDPTPPATSPMHVSEVDRMESYGALFTIKGYEE